MAHEAADGTAREAELQNAIRNAVRTGDDDALAAVVEQLQALRFVEVRRVLTGLEADPHALRRVAEAALSMRFDPGNPPVDPAR